MWLTSGLAVRGGIWLRMSIGMLSLASFVVAMLKGSTTTTVSLVPCELVTGDKMRKMRPAVTLPDGVCQCFK